MGSSSDKSTSSPGLAAALELFPSQSRRIRDLFQFDESFIGLCEDLADARAALTRIEQLPDDVRDARRAEYRELVAALRGEIEEALSKANIVSLDKDRRPLKP
jgi:hypothetical protein